VICGNSSPATLGDHAGQDGGHAEGLGGLGQARRVVDHHLRVVAVQVGELVGLVVDQNEDRVFGTKKRSEAIAKSHECILCCPLRKLVSGNMARAAARVRSALSCSDRCGSTIPWRAVSRNGERQLDIEELQTFVEVADAGGVSAAALRLGVAKSIVSRRLARLEAELGVQLLARSTRGAALTEAGATFRDHAARVCAEIDVAKETILPAGDLRGRLRIAAPLSFGPTHFAPMLAEMARRHPSCTSRPATAIASSISSRKVTTVRYGSAICRTPT
jgi:molybdenum-dependent DNA-binding transcriptional regulator ModE